MGALKDGLSDLSEEEQDDIIHPFVDDSDAPGIDKPKGLVKNIEVSGRLGEHVGVSAEAVDGKARYHVWLDADLEVEDGHYGRIIYKNPPLDSKRGDPRHFENKRLNVDAAKNRAILNEMRVAVLKGDLINKFVASEKAEEKRKERAYDALSKLGEAREALLAIALQVGSPNAIMKEGEVGYEALYAAAHDYKAAKAVVDANPVEVK